MEIETFWNKYTKADNDCVVFIGVRNKAGYGLIRVKRDNRWTCQPASRWIYEYIHKVKLERWQFVCHSCDNPSCVKPSHLWVGSPKDNIQDMIANARQAKRYEFAQRMRTHSQDKVDAIRADNRSLKVVAVAHGVSESYVSKLRNNKLKRAIKPTIYSSPLLNRIMSSD